MTDVDIIAQMMLLKHAALNAIKKKTGAGLQYLCVRIDL
jgi:hypothetical protein